MQTSNVTAHEERPSSFGGECYPAREFYFEKKNDVLCEKKKLERYRVCQSKERAVLVVLGESDA